MIHMTYMNAELELVRFAAEDVLATSTEPEQTTTERACKTEDPELPPDEF